MNMGVTLAKGTAHENVLLQLLWIFLSLFMQFMLHAFFLV